jgi:CheY-like chemotaxis protein
VSPEILIVGDRSRQDGLRQHIEQLGYLVETRAPHELDRRVQQGPAPGAIIVCTADTDPAVLMARLRRSRRGSAIPVVLFGRLGGELRDLADVLDLGADHFVEEPVDGDTLATVLRELAGAPAQDATASDAGRRESTAGGRSSSFDEHVDARTADHEWRQSMFGTGTGPINDEGQAIGQLHRTLDIVESRLRASATESPDEDDEVGADDRYLASMGLDAVPDVNGDSDFVDPAELESRPSVVPEQQSATAVDGPTSASQSSQYGRRARVESTVRLADTAAPATPHVKHATPAPVSVSATSGSVRRRRPVGLPAADSGSLGEIEIPRLLWKLHRARFTGRLTVVRGRVEKRISLVDGEVLFATSNLSQDRLVDGLRRRGVLTRAQYDTARGLAAKEPRRAGQLLVEAGFVKPRELHRVLRVHLRRIVDSTFSWEEGMWSLEHGTPCEEKVVLEIPTAALIMDGIRHGMHLRQLSNLLGGDVQYPRLRENASSRAGGVRGLVEELRLTPSEECALAWLDGRRTLAEIVRDEQVDELELHALAYGLLVLDLLELPGEPRPTTAPDHDPAALDRRRLLERLRIARQGDYFTLLGIGRDATRADVVRAHDDLTETFSDEHLEEVVVEELAHELRELQVALDQARALLADDALRSAYLAHLEDA